MWWGRGGHPGLAEGARNRTMNEGNQKEKIPLPVAQAVPPRTRAAPGIPRSTGDIKPRCLQKNPSDFKNPPSLATSTFQPLHVEANWAGRLGW